jgi:RNA polymerase sigma-70 factor, ECF subfamily
MLDASRPEKSPADVRKRPVPDDLTSVGGQEGHSSPDPVAAIYRRALPHVYGYLLSRCGSVSLAEDLAAETFMAAVDAARQPGAPDITVAWLVGVARHKLADHWRRSVMERRTVAAGGQPAEALDDPWDEWLDTEAAYAALRCLNAHQRAALTLRYLDGLPVAEVARHLGRSLRATETLLARARTALRGVYLKYRMEERDGR